MNKNLLLIALFSIFAFGSCTQEYICQCEITYDGLQPGLPDPVVKEFFIKDTHDEATKKCEENSNQYITEDDLVISEDSIIMVEKCQLF